MPQSEKTAMIVQFRDDLISIKVPTDGDQHLVILLISPEGVQPFLNGSPIDPQSGEPESQTEMAPEALLKAADDMVEVWADGGWKISTTYNKVKAAVEKYQKIRSEMKTSQKDIDDTTVRMTHENVVVRDTITPSNGPVREGPSDD